MVPNRFESTRAGRLELNVRGYTMRHPSVQGPLRGTVAALSTRRVIDHLKYLGVDCVELMPIAAFIDDAEVERERAQRVLGVRVAAAHELRTQALAETRRRLRARP